jgi:hypothetical protein
MNSGKPAHLDFDPSQELRLVYNKQLGNFVKPIKQTRLYIKMIPVDWLSQALTLSFSAVRVGLACWFIDGCNKQKPFTLTRTTCQRFAISKWDKRRGLKQLENAGLIEILRVPGRLSLITMVRDGGSEVTGRTEDNI